MRKRVSTTTNIWTIIDHDETDVRLIIHYNPLVSKPTKYVTVS